MSDLQNLLTEYVAEHQAGGEADPQPYLARVSATERKELAALIDAYLVQAPRQPFDADRYRGSTAERTVEELERALGGSSGLWPALLPQLRNRVGLKRSELVQRLARALGVGDNIGKVAAYYHQMEQGLLPAVGVSDRVLDALGQMIGESAQALREAGRAIHPPEMRAAAGPAAFARRASADAAATPLPAAVGPVEAELWDEVDALFRGG